MHLLLGTLVPPKIFYLSLNFNTVSSDYRENARVYITNNVSLCLWVGTCNSFMNIVSITSISCHMLSLFILYFLLLPPSLSPSLCEIFTCTVQPNTTCTCVIIIVGFPSY